MARRRNSWITRGGLNVSAAKAKQLAPGYSAAQSPPLVAPPGYYDPALDAQNRNVQTGFHDTYDWTNPASDFVKNYGMDGKGGRALTDYTTDRTDVLTGGQQAWEDLGTARSREQQGYTQRTQDLGTQYQRLGSSQTQRAHAMGVMGGALVQAAQKRAANQQHDQGALDTQHNNNVSDFNTSQTRMFGDGTPDFATGTVGGSIGRQLGKLALGRDRQIEDAGTTAVRAFRDTNQFGLDTNASKLFSARQNGWVPPAPGVGPNSQIGSAGAVSARAANARAQQSARAAHSRAVARARRRGRGPIASINQPRVS